MPRARKVLAALKKDGWKIVAQEGSHKKLRKGSETHTFAFRDGDDLGQPGLGMVANEFGYSLEELRKLL